MKNVIGAPLIDDTESIFDMPEKSEPVNKKSEAAWTWALALVNAAGGSPTPDFLALIEREKHGEITTKDMKKYLDEKYKGKPEHLYRIVHDAMQRGRG